MSPRTTTDGAVSDWVGEQLAKAPALEPERARVISELIFGRRYFATGSNANTRGAA